MLNTHALDALAALCGTAPSVNSPAAAISGCTSNSNGGNASPLSTSYAMLARQQEQAIAARQAALTAIPSGILQAYLAATTGAGVGVTTSQAIAPPPPSDPSPSRRITLPDHGAVAAPTSFATGYGDVSHSHGLAALQRPSVVNHPDPRAEARALAMKIVLAQQLQQQEQQQQVSHQQQHSRPRLASLDLSQAPAAALPLQPLMIHSAHAALAAAATTAPMTMETVSSMSPGAVATAAVSSLLLHNHNPLPLASDVKSNSQVKRSFSDLASNAKPPPKKRLAHARRQSSEEEALAAIGLGAAADDVNSAALKSVMFEWEDKKEAKRAANRLSAHMSRKRKKMYIEVLKGENEELRRKEMILQSIPDLIIVFDSSGSMPFVSQSVSRFLNFTSEELQDTSFWMRLTPDSVRAVKSAFMDALAAKQQTGEHEDRSTSTPLWNGESMVVKLLDRNGVPKVFSLKGVVHFSEEVPECVCSIRPEESGQRRGLSCPSGSKRRISSPGTRPISDIDST